MVPRVARCVWLLFALAAPLGVGCSPAASPTTPLGPRGPELTRDAPLRWAIPSCPIRYEVKSVETTAMKGAAASPGGLETFIALEVRPAKGHVELIGTVTPQVRTGKHRSYETAVRGYAPIHLTTDGLSWSEIDGPTHLFQVLGTQGGLSWFFPSLPESAFPGASIPWTVPRSDKLSALNTEAARGSLPGMKAALESSLAGGAQPVVLSPMRAQVRMERWFDLGGERVAELSLRAENDEDEDSKVGPTDFKAHVHAIHRGTFVITAKGRLLRATLERNAEFDLAFAGTEPQHHVQRTQRDIHLVAACDGPVEATLKAPLSREERAIFAWGDAVVAILEGNKDIALRGFDPGVGEKHGADRVWATLESYKTERGARAFGIPILLGDDAVSVAGASVVLQMQASVSTGGRNAMTESATMTVTLAETGGRFVVTAITSEVGANHANLLRVSSDGLVVRRGWPPK